MRRPNFNKLAEHIDIGQSSTLTKFVSYFGYLAPFQTRVAEKRVVSKIEAKFNIFDPPPCKN